MPPREPGPSTFLRLCWAFTALAAIVAGGGLVVALLFISQAPAQGALAAICVGVAVVPYVFSRSCSEIRRG